MPPPATDLPIAGFRRAALKWTDRVPAADPPVEHDEDPECAEAEPDAEWTPELDDVAE